MLHLFHKWSARGTIRASKPSFRTTNSGAQETLAACTPSSITAAEPLSFEEVFMPRVARFALAAVCVAALSGCAVGEFIVNDINKTLGKAPGNERQQADLAAAQVTTIGVNSYLWRAALETLSFAPMAQVDSAGGVIVTDWYTNPSTPTERVKVTATILDADLRADALRVAASRQVNQNGQWIDAPVAAATVQKLEEIILTKARDLRRSAVPG
jgi:hypothetical protein